MEAGKEGSWCFEKMTILLARVLHFRVQPIERHPEQGNKDEHQHTAFGTD